MYDVSILTDRSKNTKQKLTLNVSYEIQNHTVSKKTNKITQNVHNVIGQELTLSTRNQVPKVRVARANCKALFQNSTNEQEKINKFGNERESSQLTLPIKCEEFRKERQYMSATSKEEMEFPLAFSLKMYRNPERAERLLRAIYRPQNFYCIHVDAKAEEHVYNIMRAISDCFPNVMMSQRLDVRWGTMSVVEAELVCMRTLWKYHWEYLLNLTGEEFPLKTNGQNVRILKTFNGTNAVHGLIKR